METPFEQPLFSILVANYNNARYLQECIDSVESQTYPNWEIIIVDDGSTDHSERLLNDFGQHPKIKVYFNSQNQGCGFTKRRTVELAEGNICGFLDPDDVIAPETIELMVDQHLKHPDASMVYSTFYNCNEQLEILHQFKGAGPVSMDQSIFNSKPDSKTVAPFVAFKKSKYLQTDGINPNLKRAVDKDLYYKLEEVGDLKFVGRPLYYYRRHKNGISTADNSIKAKYWHALVARKTYLRRKQNPNITRPNITRRELRKYFEDYFYWKAMGKKKQRQWFKAWFCILRSFQYETFLNTSSKVRFLFSLCIAMFRK